MESIVVDLNISRDEWLKIYRGESNRVYAVSRDGRSVQFPAGILTRYTTLNGIRGSFVITVDESGKFRSIVKL